MRISDWGSDVCCSDHQIHVTPRLVGDFDRAPPPGHGITLNPCILRPTSRGTVKLRSADPKDSPMLVANNLTTREDVETLMRGLRLSRRILRAPALAAVVARERLEEHTSELQSLLLITYAAF